jgi:hypothetical protein
MTKKTKQSKKLSDLIFKNPYVRESWADYASLLLHPKWVINRYDDKKGNRFYYFVDGKEVVIGAGSTTVIERVMPYEERRYIEKWKESNPNWRHLLDISGEYGTLEHITHGDIMFQKGVNKSTIEAMQKIIVEYGGNLNMPIKDVLAFMKFQEDFQLVPLLIEASLAWQDPETKEWLMMTIDLLAKMTVTIKTKTQVEDGVYLRGANKGQPRFKDVTTEEKVEKILLIDFKGNFFDKDDKKFYESNKLQLQAAKLAVEQNFDIKVDDVYNYAPKNWHTEPSYTLTKWDLTQHDWDVFYNYWKTAQLKGYNKPEGKMLITDGLKDSKDYKFLTYREYVEQILLSENK